MFARVFVMSTLVREGGSQAVPVTERKITQDNSFDSKIYSLVLETTKCPTKT